MSVAANDRSIPVQRLPFYFGPSDKPLFGWIHYSPQVQAKDTGVVICPPIAAEYISSHRSLRHLADDYARAGIPAIRFDYHGMGDSSGQLEDNDRFDSWLWSVQLATQELKNRTGVNKVGAVGLRFGAAMATKLAEQESLEFLILWAPVVRGRTLIREIKAMQMTSNSQPDGDPALLDAGGMVYWEQTANDIQAINLEQIKPLAKRILLIPRDNLAADTKLLQAWQEMNLNVEQIELEGSSGMLQDAAFTVVPHASFDRVIQWTLTGAVANGNADTLNNISADEFHNEINIQYKDISDTANAENESSLHEYIHWWGEDKNRFAIITESNNGVSADLPLVVILNSGATHHVGPNQINLLIARTLACAGFRCVRADLRGLGDSIVKFGEKENVEYLKGGVNEVKDLLTSLTGLATSFVLTGLCSGAYFSYRSALFLNDMNIRESLLLNPLTFYWEEGMAFGNSPSKQFSNWNWYMQTIKNPKSWLKLLSGKADVRFLLQTIRDRIKIRLAAFSKNTGLNKKETANNAADELIKDLAVGLEKIANKNIHVGLVLSRNDPGYDIVMTSAGRVAKNMLKQQQMNIDFIEGADHTFSKYRPRRDFITAIRQHLKSRYM